MVEVKRLAIALTLVVAAALSVFLSSLTSLSVKGEIKIVDVKVYAEENRLIAYVENVGNVTVFSEKAYLTLPSGLKVIGMVEVVEVKPGEVKLISIDFSIYTTIRLTEEGEYVLELHCSNNAVDEFKFRV